MSCVTKTMVFWISACRRRNSFWIRSRLIGSMAPNGSSMRSTGGAGARAPGTPQRRRPGHADALALAARELGGIAVADLVRIEGDEIDELVDAVIDPVLVPLQQL